MLCCINSVISRYLCKFLHGFAQTLTIQVNMLSKAIKSEPEMMQTTQIAPRATLTIKKNTQPTTAHKAPLRPAPSHIAAPMVQAVKKDVSARKLREQEKRALRHAMQEAQYEHERVQEVIKKAWPYLFKPTILPLAIGIYAQMYRRARELALPVQKWEIRCFIARHCADTSYRKMLTFGGWRYDIDGRPVEAITARHSELAKLSIQEAKAALRASREAEKTANQAIIKAKESPVQ